MRWKGRWLLSHLPGTTPSLWRPESSRSCLCCCHWWRKTQQSGQVSLVIHIWLQAGEHLKVWLWAASPFNSATLLHLSFLPDRISHRLARHFQQGRLPASPQEQAACLPVPPVLGWWHSQPHTAFYMGTGDLNPDPCVLTHWAIFPG